MALGNLTASLSGESGLFLCRECLWPEDGEPGLIRVALQHEAPLLSIHPQVLLCPGYPSLLAMVCLQ